MTSFAELQEVYRKFKEHNVKLHQTIFPGVPKTFASTIPTATCWNFICNVPPEEYRKTVSNPYYNYGSIEDELAGKSPVPSRLDCTHELKPEVTS